MKHILTSILIFVVFLINAQIVTTVPEFPVPSQAVTVTFNATGTALEGYSGDIYAHTGVTFDGVRWKNVIGSWGTNTTQPKLTRTGTNTYILNISPSINTFYSVTAGKIVTEMCFVFRSADATKQSSDLFVDVFSDTDISFLSPDPNQIYSINDLVNINAVALNADDMTLYVNDIEQTSITGDEIDFNFTALTSGDNTIKVVATYGVDIIEKETTFFVRGANVIEDLPSASLVDGINYIDNTSVTLVLYAPFKDFVYVKGSFDNWALTLANQMKRTSDGNRYWITITGLTPGVEYIYQYIVDGTLTIADPYTDKISDPWNDHYISSTTYPNLISYPTGKTIGIASVFQTAQTPYTWAVENFNKPAKQDLIIYELLVRDFIARHDYQTLIDTIAYFKKLGINAIELMPASEFEGNNSWGYNPSFYFAPDKYYGTKNKLKEFIDVCHQNDIAVILDIVLNHSMGQSPLAQLYFDSGTGKPTAENPWYNVDSPNTSYFWGSDFDHESTDTKKFVSRVVKYWLEEYKFDGYRFDFTKGFTNKPGDGWAYDASRIQILKNIADTIWTTSPNAYVILEHFAENTEEIILSDYGMMIWGNMNYNYLEASMGYLPGSNFSGVSYKNRSWNQPHLVGYMESHDEERLMYKNITWGNSNETYNITEIPTALERSELAAAFFFTIPGPKMIWQFAELGYDKSINTCEDGTINDQCRTYPKPILWNYYSDEDRHNLYKYYSALIKFRTSNDVFKTSDFDISLSGAIKQIVLRHSSMNAVVIGNFDIVSQNADPDLSSKEIWYDYYTQKEYNKDAVFDLSPGEYKILTGVKLELPDVPKEEEILKPTYLYVYPNPVVDYITISGQERFDKIFIYNLMGNVVFEFSPIGEEQINISKLRPGLYFIKGVNTGESEIFKFIKL